MQAVSEAQNFGDSAQEEQTNIFHTPAEQTVIKKPVQIYSKILTTTYTKRDIHQKLRLRLMKILQTIGTNRWQIKQNQITNGNFLATVFRFWLLAHEPNTIDKSKSLHKVLLSSFVMIHFQYVTPIGISKCCNRHH